MQREVIQPLGLARPIGPYSHVFSVDTYPRIFPDGVYLPNTLLIVDGLVSADLLLEIEAVAAV